MTVQKSRFVNIWAQNKQIIFIRLKLWVAVARHIFKAVKSKLFNLALEGLKPACRIHPITNL